MYKTAKEIAEELVYAHGFDVEYTSIGDALENHIYDKNLPEMDYDEFDRFRSEVDDWISKASISVIFEEE